MQGPEICRPCKGVRIYSGCDDFHLQVSSLGVTLCGSGSRKISLTVVWNIDWSRGRREEAGLPFCSLLF